MSTLKNFSAGFSMATFEGRRAHAHSVMLRVAALEQPFDIRVWAEDYVDPYDCGTAACACGWIARTEEAQAEGFALSGSGRLIYHQHVEFNAAAVYFGISDYTALQLFTHRGYGTARSRPISALEVAAKMEELGWNAPQV